MSTIRDSLLRLHDLSQSGDALSEADVAAFESELGSQLPRDYREFLLLRNGGRLQFHQAINNELVVDRLYGLIPDTSYMDLRWKRDCFRDRIPPSFLAIGDFGGASYLCLSLKPQEFGWVYSWDRSEEMTTPFDRMTRFVAKSFGEVLKKLGPYDWSDTEQEANRLPEPFRSITKYDIKGLTRYLTAGGDVDIKGNKSVGVHNTPLLTCICSWPYAAGILLKHGANFHVRNKDGLSPIELAAGLGSYDGVKLLLAAGADPLEMDANGENALRRAISMRYERIEKAIRIHLEQRGIHLDYEKLHQDVERCNRIKEFARNAARPDAEDQVAFSTTTLQAAMLIDDSGFLLGCARPISRQFNEERVWQLAELMEIFPCSPQEKELTDPMKRALYDFCRNVVAQVGLRFVSPFFRAKVGELASGVRQLYRDAKAATRDCATAEQATTVLDQRSMEFQQQLFDSLQGVLRTTPLPPPTPSVPVETIEPEMLRLLAPWALGSVMIPRSGYHVWFRSFQATGSSPTLEQVVDIGPKVMYYDSSDETSVDITHPVIYERYDIIQLLYRKIAPKIVVTRREVTLGDVAKCVTEAHEDLLQVTWGCNTAQEVLAKATCTVRRRLGRELKRKLRAKCT